MPVKKRTMAREGWTRMLESAFTWREYRDAAFDGEIGAIDMRRVRAPLMKRMGERDVRIADDGFRWLQLAPRGQYWWLTVMMDENGRIQQYYFDVTRENALTGDGGSYFLDLFLDVVALPSGEIFLLDEDELEGARNAGEISNAEFDSAYAVARELIGWARASLPEIEALVRRCERALSQETQPRRAETVGTERGKA